MGLRQVLALSLAVGAITAAPHYTFPSIVGTNDWQYVRQTINYQTNAPVTDVTSTEIRCYQNAGITASTESIAAGSTVTFTVNPDIFHPGPLQFYMAKAPTGQNIATWDGSGTVWFKIFSQGPTFSNGQMNWPSLNAATVSVKIPSSLPAGDYLLRVEHIALHAAATVNGAQFYLSCAQVHVTGSGTGTPGPLVTFPGAYSATDPGILINIYSGTTSYTAPGPAVWTG